MFKSYLARLLAEHMRLARSTAAPAPTPETASVRASDEVLSPWEEWMIDHNDTHQGYNHAPNPFDDYVAQLSNGDRDKLTQEEQMAYFGQVIDFQEDWASLAAQAEAPAKSPMLTALERYKQQPSTDASFNAEDNLYVANVNESSVLGAVAKLFKR